MNTSTEQFQWDDELVKEWTEYLLDHCIDNGALHTLLEKFKRSKIKKEEPLPIRVCEIRRTVTFAQQIGEDKVCRYDFYTSSEIPSEKYEPIKKAIESVLLGNVHEGNYETFTNGYTMGRYDASKYDQKQYTHDDLLKAQKEAFEAAREMAKIPDMCYDKKFPTFNDYINSLK